MTSSGETSPASLTPSGTPSLSSHAPKYGITIRNRIFVGGIPAGTTEQELKTYFSSKGAVKDVKIITDRAGVSKGYGFVTFETQEDADKILKEAGDFMFKERKLNVGVAIRKQVMDNPPVPLVYGSGGLPAGAVLLSSNGVSYSYQNGMAFFHPPEGGYPVPTQAQAATYPMMLPPGQAVYVSQPYAYQSPAAATSPTQWPSQQWRWTSPGLASPVGSQYPLYPMQALTPEMLYQPTAQGYTTADLADAGLMEAAPAEKIRKLHTKNQ